jgi:hypothetical protein
MIRPVNTNALDPSNDRDRASHDLTFGRWRCDRRVNDSARSAMLDALRTRRGQFLCY